MAIPPLGKYQGLVTPPDFICHDFDKDYFLFTIDLKYLYTNISVKDAIKITKNIFSRYQNIIPNAHFITELMELVLNCAIMKFQEDFFMQILGIVTWKLYV